MCRVSEWVFCLWENYSETGGPRTLQTPSSPLAVLNCGLWPPLLTNRIPYRNCTDEVQGERDCCELAIFVVSWVVSAWVVLGDRKQKAGSRSQEGATVVSRAEWVPGTKSQNRGIPLLRLAGSQAITGESGWKWPCLKSLNRERGGSEWDPSWETHFHNVLK